MEKARAQAEREKALEELISATSQDRARPRTRAGGADGAAGPDVSESPAEALTERAKKEIHVISEVTRISQNLKGTCKRALNDSAKAVGEIVRELANRSTNEETRVMKVTNDRLRRELEDLRREMAEMRREMEAMRARGPPPAPSTSTRQGGSSAADEERQTLIMGQLLEQLREMPRTILQQVGKMMDARFAVIEGRIPPEERLRPPLKGDTGGKAAPDPAPRALREVAVTSQHSRPGKGAGAGRGGSVEAGEQRASRKTPQPSVTDRAAIEDRVAVAPPADAEDTWSKVVGRRTRAAAKKREQPRPQVITSGAAKTARGASASAVKGATGGSGRGAAKTQQPPANKPQGQGARPAGAKIRPPRTAAVVLTALGGEGAFTLAEAMAEVKRRIALKDLGIELVKPRRAVTGALILEVPGQEGAAKADALAEKMREALAGKGVKVSRPVKRAELRIAGLDESVSAVELALALADAGGCAADQAKIGTVRRAPNGLGTAWVQLPAAAARKLAVAGKVRVGWVSARVDTLAPRPLQCYRCLGVGHVRQHCTEAVDRSDECYRCGVPGHRAGGCTADPHCPLCADRGRPANHRAGRGACAAPPKKQKGAGGGAPSAPAPAKAAKGGKPPQAVERTRAEGGSVAPPTHNEGSSGPRGGPREDAMDVEQ